MAESGAAIRAGIVLAAAGIAAALIVFLAQHFLPGLVASFGPAMQQTIFLIGAFLPLLIVAVLGGWLIERRSVLPTGEAPGKSGAGSLALGIGGFALALLLTRLAHGIGAGGAGGGTIGLLLLSILIVLFQSTVEEIYFRGWIQPALVRGWGFWPGLLVTSAAFALLHMAGGARSPLSLVNILLAGMVFGLLAWRTGGIVAPACAHFGWNWAEANLFGAYPNPGVDPLGSIWNLDLIGAASWGGNDEGMNASLAAFFVLSAIVVLLAGWSPLGVPEPRRTAQPG